MGDRLTLATLSGAIPLAEVRLRLAEALAPAQDSDPDVIDGIADALSPPVLVLDWDDPWLEPSTIGLGPWVANIAVLCVAGRVEPGAGVEALEGLIAYTVGRLRADPISWPVVNARAPRAFEIGGLTYLGARLIVAPRISIEEA